MILKTQLVAAVMLAAGLFASPAAAAKPVESGYCQCLVDCDGDYPACSDYCAMIHMVTICEAAALDTPKDRR